jgi:uncharacterized membrane protein YedE/YeeE
MKNNTVKLQMNKFLNDFSVLVFFLFIGMFAYIDATFAATDSLQVQDSKVEKKAQVAVLGNFVFENYNISKKLETNNGLTKEQKTSYWAWWWGALALGLITIAFWWFLRVPLGVAGSWDRVVGWRKEQHRAAEEAALVNASKDQIMDAIMAETIAQFGEQAVLEMGQNSVATSAQGVTDTQEELPFRSPWTAHITFLACIGIGALLSVLWGSGFEIQWTLGPEFSRLFGAGWHQWIILFLGGICVGFGIRLGGGCTSGHGLSGMSQYQLGSLLSTIAFFGAAIVVSLLLEYFL